MEPFILKNLWHQLRADMAGVFGNMGFLFFRQWVGESLLFKIG